MAVEGRYGSPKAFRRALTDRLTALSEKSRWELPQLQRQIAYDRLLARLYQVDRGWILKGATALLARDLGVRGTIDIDLYRDASVDAALRELRAAARRPTSATGSPSRSAPSSRCATARTDRGCRSRR